MDFLLEEVLLLLLIMDSYVNQKWQSDIILI